MSCTVKLVQAHTDLWLRHKMLILARKWPLKKVANAFEDMIDAKRMLREVRLMRQFNHPNVVKLYDIMEPPYIEDFEDLYIVTELMSTDLQKILYSKTKLTGEQMQYLLYQLLAGMNYKFSICAPPGPQAVKSTH